MNRTHHLIQPNQAPCPGYNDIPAPPPRPFVDMSGMGRCTYNYNDKNRNKTDFIQLDNFNPERFNHNQFRYQMFARPANYECSSDTQSAKLKANTSTYYRPAHTDVRALQQTMYIPIVPSNPGGETQVTFPMTPQTMGQPDVTSACCVPVIPSQPGYRNMTQGILPGPCNQLNGPVGGAIPSSSGGAGCPYLRQMCGTSCGCGGGCRGEGGYPQKRRGCGCAHCAPQIIRPPSNVPGGSCQGLPDTFPATVQHQMGSKPACSYANQMAPISTLQLPHYTGAMSLSYEALQNQIGRTTDGMPRDKICTNASMIRHQDRSNRAIMRFQETPAAKRRRMREVYGHYGAYLLPTPYQKRHDIQIRPDLIQLQGNGFQWDYPSHQNRQCYVLSRHSRCS